MSEDNGYTVHLAASVSVMKPTRRHFHTHSLSQNTGDNSNSDKVLRALLDSAANFVRHRSRQVRLNEYVQSEFSFHSPGCNSELHRLLLIQYIAGEGH